jgi:hypothetical protein
MKTIVESPNRRLRRELGLPDIPASGSRPRVGDWMKLNCGDHVREKDGRHEGRVEAILHGAWVIVKWDESGWKSELALSDVEIVR